MGLLTLGWAAASTLGPLVAGGLADAYGHRAAYALMIGSCVIVGLWLLRADMRHASPAHSKRAVDLGRLYNARSLDELRGEYERIAPAYDVELVNGMGYRSPGEVAAVTRRFVTSEARILDVGAGTGLLGVALAEAGFTRLEGLDLSPNMLAQAAQKQVYARLREGTLGDSLDYETGTYDAVVAAGVLTTGHAPAECLDELIRITRPGGHVIFTLRTDQMPTGFEDKIDELEIASRWRLVELGDEFQALPTGEPEVRVRVFAFRVL